MCVCVCVCVCMYELIILYKYTSVTCITCQMWIFVQSAVTNLHLPRPKIVDEMRIPRYAMC